MLINGLRTPVVAAVITGWLAACSGGGGGSSGGGVTPPSDFTYSNPASYVLNQTITPLVPTIKGQVTQYTVSPALPEGLSVNQGDGAIAGSPGVLSPQTTYTVTAQNAGGSTSTTVSIAVITPSNEISYTSPKYTFTVGVPAEAIGPTVKAGTVSSWAISPALPAGLTFDTTNGIITGLATAGAPAANYLITAQLPGGQSSTNLSIVVESGPLFDLGHASQITLLRMDTNAVLSRDFVNHWVLWNYATGAQLASNGVPCPQTTQLVSPSCQLTPVDLAGPTAVIQTTAGLEVRSATTGQVEAEIPLTSGSWKLAADGSYICAWGSGLTVWSPTGTMLFNIPGNYGNAVLYAAPHQILVGNGPAGANVIQTISIPGGTATLSPSFQGVFQSWFADGSRFLSAVLNASGPSTWWVYSSSAVQQDLAMISSQSVAGQGNWYWSGAGNKFNLYAVGSSGTATVTYPAATVVPSPQSQTIALTTSGQFIVLDLSGASPVATNYTLPFAGEADYLNGIPYAATSTTSWVVGGFEGQLLDGASLASQARYFGYGAPTLIAGSANSVAVATVTGPILVLNPLTRALQTTIHSQSLSSPMLISNDGSMLVTLTPNPNPQLTSVTEYALPAGTVISTFSIATPDFFTMSASGTVFGEVSGGIAPECNAYTFSTPGVYLWNTTTCGASLALSPDGTEIAYVQGNVSALYQSGNFVTTIPAVAMGWLSDNTLFASTPAALYASNGALSSSLPLKQQMITDAQLVPPASLTTAAALLYSYDNTIYNLSNGMAVWSSGTAVSSTYLRTATAAAAAFQAQNLILAEAY